MSLIDITYLRAYPLDFWDKISTHLPEFTGEDKAQGACTTCFPMYQDSMKRTLTQYITEELGVPLPPQSNEAARLAAHALVREKLGLPLEEQNWDAADEARDRILLSAPLSAKPGTRFSYYNFGYVMLKMIIEKISGKRPEDGHWLLPEAKRGRFVTRDPSFKGGEFINSLSVMNRTSPSGGLKSTLADLTVFGQMFLSGGTYGGVRIFSPASVGLMTRDHNAGVPDSFWRRRRLGSDWGYGCDVKNGKLDDIGMLRNESSYNHTGYAGSRLLVDPDAELVTAFYPVERISPAVECQAHNS